MRRGLTHADRRPGPLALAPGFSVRTRRAPPRRGDHGQQDGAPIEREAERDRNDRRAEDAAQQGAAQQGATGPGGSEQETTERAGVSGEQKTHTSDPPRGVMVNRTVPDASGDAGTNTSAALRNVMRWNRARSPFARSVCWSLGS